MTANSTDSGDLLDFDSPGTDDTPGQPACTVCGRVIPDQYYSANNVVLCEGCARSVMDSQEVTGGGALRVLRATGLGMAGMLAGAGVWYAVAKLANIEAALIAILLGFLVGKGVFIGSGRRGGRGFQVLAVGLTYLGIALAYTPFAVEAYRTTPAEDSVLAATLSEPSATSPAQVADGEVARLDSLIAAAEADSAAPRDVNVAQLGLGVGFLLLAVLSLPVFVVIGSGLPGSLISVLIYGFAIYQAWKAAARTSIRVEGPFLVNASAG